MGHSFAAGTTDGPGLFGFKQGETMPNNPLWNALTNTIATPSENQTKCHGIKPILLTTGEVIYINKCKYLHILTNFLMTHT